jgi:palmitoyltransferase ZDHHC9/14/18
LHFLFLVISLQYVLANQTTYENFRYRYDNKVNPYNQGCPSNFKEIFCTTIPPSQNKFRAKVEEVTPGQLGVPTLTRQAGEDVTSSTGKGPDLELGYQATWPGAEDTVAEGGELEMMGGRVSTGSELGIGMEKDGFDPHHMDQGRAPVFHPRRSSWGRKSGSWEITPDRLAISSEGTHRTNGGATPPSNR